MQITVISVSTPVSIPTGKGRPYRKLEVLHKNDKGYNNTQTLVSFKNPSVFKTMEGAKTGQIYEVDEIKNEGGFREWKSARLVEAQAEGVVDAGLKTGELPKVDTTGVATKAPIKVQVTELDRNRYIVRQSSLERAIETLAGSGSFSVADVTKVAEQYEAWVFRPVAIEADNAKAAIAVVKAVAPAATAVEVARRPGRPRKAVPVTYNVEDANDYPDSEVGTGEVD